MLTMVVPSALGAAIGYAKGWPATWRQANWDSSGTLPDAATIKSAKVLVLASRTGQWKGIFAEHMSIVMKLAGETTWTRYDVVGWGMPVRENAYPADAYWYGNSPRVIHELEGEAAERLIPAIKTTIQKYPYSASGSYLIWPRGSCAIRMASRPSSRRLRWARIISARDCSLPARPAIRDIRFR